MSNNKQSSIEILEDFLLQHCNPTVCNVEWSDFKLAIEQAKAMHRVEIIESYASGSNDRLRNTINTNYYNETFGE